MTSPLDPIKEALRQFSSSDDQTREKGFSTLVARSRPFLIAQFSGSRLPEADREDVIQDVFHRVWRARHRLDFPNAGSWWRWIRTIASNCMVDMLRSRDPSISIEDLENSEIPDDELELIDDLIDAMDDRRRLYRLADEVFLEIPETMSERDRNRRLFAAKMLLIDKLPWQTVCRMLNAGCSEDAQVSRKQLDEWVSSPSLLRCLAFSELNWDNHRLCEYLLSGSVNAPSARPWTRTTPWSADEAFAIQLRFQHVMLLDQVVARLSDRLTKSQLISVFDSCAERFPFIEIVRRLNADFDFGRRTREPLSSQGLWHRLVFQYYSHNGLPHRDIFDRTSAAAKEAGYMITMGMLNVGLSNGRLFKRLADHLAKKENKDAIKQSAR